MHSTGLECANLVKHWLQRGKLPFWSCCSDRPTPDSRDLPGCHLRMCSMTNFFWTKVMLQYSFIICLERLIEFPGIDACLPSPGLPKTSYNRVVISPQCFHEWVILFALLRFSKCLPLLQWPFDPFHCPASDGVKIMGRQPSRDLKNRLKSVEQVRIVKHVNIGKCEKIVRSSFLKNVSLMVRSRA